MREIQEGKTGGRGDADPKYEASSEAEPISKSSDEDLGDKLLRAVPELDENSTLPKAVRFPGVEGFTGALEIFYFPQEAHFFL